MECYDPQVAQILGNLLNTIKLPYKLTELQEIATHILGKQKNLFVLTGTGAGKSLILILAILVLREIMKQPKGKCY